MKRWLTGMTAFLAMILLIGGFVLASAPNVELEIPADCAVDVITGEWTYSGAMCDAEHNCGVLGCLAPHYCGTVITFTGNHNQDWDINVEATQFNDGAGHTLETWIQIGPDEYEVIDPMAMPPYWSKLVSVSWATTPLGDWSLDINVGFVRAGYGDLAGVYTATVTVSCTSL